jgi:hypothetical protein
MVAPLREGGAVGGTDDMPHRVICRRQKKGTKNQEILDSM